MRVRAAVGCCVAFALGAGLPPLARAERDGGLMLTAAVALQYDDNILSGNAQTVGRLEKNVTEERYGLVSADDWVAIGNVALLWSTRILPRRETVFSAGVETHRYDQNTVKDYEEVDFSVTQEVTASRRYLGRVIVGGQWIPGFFVRNLTDDDASVEAGRRVRAGATYGQRELAIAYEQELAPGRLFASAGREWRERDYNAAFDERDATRRLWALSLRGRPLARGGVQLEGGYAWGSVAARGDLASSPFPDDDISYDVAIAGLSARAPWGRRRPGAVTLAWEGERRVLATTNRFDVLRHGRVDRRTEWNLRLSQRVAADLDLVAEWRFDGVRAKFPTAFTALAASVDYERQRISLGLRYRVPLGS